MLRLEFDGEEWTSSFPHEAQPSVSHCIESQSASTVERNDTAAASYHAKVSRLVGFSKSLQVFICSLIIPRKPLHA